MRNKISVNYVVFRQLIVIMLGAQRRMIAGCVIEGRIMEEGSFCVRDQRLHHVRYAHATVF